VQINVVSIDKRSQSIKKLLRIRLFNWPMIHIYVRQNQLFHVT